MPVLLEEIKADVLGRTFLRMHGIDVGRCPMTVTETQVRATLNEILDPCSITAGVPAGLDDMDSSVPSASRTTAPAVGASRSPSA